MKTLLTSVVVLAVVGVAVSASASVLWDGSGDPTSGGNYTLEGGAFQYDTESGAPQVGVAYQTTSSGYYPLSNSLASTELVNANGWDVETRVQVLSTVGAPYAGGIGVYMADGARVLGFNLGTGGVQFGFSDAGGVNEVMKEVTLDSGYHIIGVRMAPGGATAKVFVDGVEKFDDFLRTRTSQAFYFGDGGSAESATANWDYLNINGGLFEVPELPGDLNGDGFVGQDDLNIVLGDWGNMPPGDPRADPSGDGFVGQDDLNPVLADWGQGTPPLTLAGSSLSAAAVPEPSSLALAMLAFGMLCRCRKRFGNACQVADLP